MNNITVDELYKSIALNILQNIDSNHASWEKAFIEVERDADDAIELGGGYTLGNNFSSFDFREFDRRIIKDFHMLHKITTDNNSNLWNKARYTLYPDGKFDIKFEWDQSLADEIEANS